MPAANTSMRATHAGGTLAAGTPTRVDTPRGTRGFRLRIRNTGANAMEISFDSGKSWFPIAAGAEFAEDIAFHFFYLRSTAGTDYAALIFEG